MVGYADVTSQPENVSANVNLELTYEQESIGTEPYNINYTKDENIVSISKTSESCSPKRPNASCSVILPNITTEPGYIGKWVDEDGNTVGRAGDSYQVNSNKTLTATIIKVNVGDTVNVKGLECGFNILSMDNQKPFFIYKESAFF